MKQSEAQILAEYEARYEQLTPAYRKKLIAILERDSDQSKLSGLQLLALKAFAGSPKQKMLSTLGQPYYKKNGTASMKQYKTHLAKYPKTKYDVGEPIHKMRMSDQSITTNFNDVDCSICLDKITRIKGADLERNRWIYGTVSMKNPTHSEQYNRSVATDFYNDFLTKKKIKSSEVLDVFVNNDVPYITLMTGKTFTLHKGRWIDADKMLMKNPSAKYEVGDKVIYGTTQASIIDKRQTPSGVWEYRIKSINPYAAIVWTRATSLRDMETPMKNNPKKEAYAIIDANQHVIITSNNYDNLVERADRHNEDAGFVEWFVVDNDEWLAQNPKQAGNPRYAHRDKYYLARVVAILKGSTPDVYSKHSTEALEDMIREYLPKAHQLTKDLIKRDYKSIYNYYMSKRNPKTIGAAWQVQKYAGLRVYMLISDSGKLLAVIEPVSGRRFMVVPQEGDNETFNTLPQAKKYAESFIMRERENPKRSTQAVEREFYLRAMEQAKGSPLTVAEKKAARKRFSEKGFTIYDDISAEYLSDQGRQYRNPRAMKPANEYAHIMTELSKHIPYGERWINLARRAARLGGQIGLTAEEVADAISKTTKQTHRHNMRGIAEKYANPLSPELREAIDREKELVNADVEKLNQIDGAISNPRGKVAQTYKGFKIIKLYKPSRGYDYFIYINRDLVVSKETADAIGEGWYADTLADAKDGINGLLLQGKYARNPRGGSRPIRDKYAAANPRGGEVDEDAARELLLYIQNDSRLMRGQGLPIYKNLITKQARGVYNHTLAIKLAMYLMDAGAKSYVLESSDGDKWNDIFNKATREAAAREFIADFESDAANGEYNHMLPKKYQNPRNPSHIITDKRGYKVKISRDKDGYAAKWTYSDEKHARKLLFNTETEAINWAYNRFAPMYVYVQGYRGARNPSEYNLDKLDSLSAMFQGEITGEAIQTLGSNLTPNTTARIGSLSLIKVRNGSDHYEINFGKDAWLSMDARKNLVINGKGAKIKNAHKSSNGNLTLLGDIEQINYITAKRHIENGETVEYYHKLGEVDGAKPQLFLDSDGFPLILNGNYDIGVNGIEN